MPPRNRRQFALWAARKLRPVVSDKVFYAIYGYARMGYVPNYTRPKTLNEKIVAWLRRTRDPRLAQRADKLAVREFIHATAPWVRTPELYEVSDDAATFDFDRLPEVSIFKANHGWRQYRVLRRPFDEEATRQIGAEWLAQRFQPVEWERHYLDIPPRLYAEEYLGDEDLPIDYKVFVLNGVARFIQLSLNRGVKLRIVTFDRDWKRLPVHLHVYRGGPADVVEDSLVPPKPVRFDDMVRAAEALADDLPFVRVDFYVRDDDIYVGELTFAPAAGFMPFIPVEYDRIFGDQLDIG